MGPPSATPDRAQGSSPTPPHRRCSNICGRHRCRCHIRRRGGDQDDAAADWTGNNRMTLPDLRGRTIAGLDDMGSTAAGRLTSAYWGLVGTTPTTPATTLGNAGGSELRALVTANMVAHTHTGTTGNQSASHTHTGTMLQNNQSLNHTHLWGNSDQGGFSGGGNAAGDDANEIASARLCDLVHTHNFTTGNERPTIPIPSQPTAAPAPALHSRSRRRRS